jgi:deoxycytidylate deaminase
MEFDLDTHFIHKSTLKKGIINQSISVAMASDSPKKMSAMLLDKRNRVISTGINSYEITHTQQFYAAVMAAKKYKKPSLAKKLYLHCEINCLLKARKPGHKLVICRIGGHGQTELRNSFCCPICFLYIIKNHPSIREIHWSTNDGEFLYVKI